MRAAIVSAVIAALGANATAGATAKPSPAPHIDAVFAGFNRTTPGCAVGVERAGKVVFAKGYGMADLEHGVPITPKTMFYMASVSKQFTALTVLTLAKENKLALTDSVRKYIPELPMVDDKITIYELLTHTSGVRDYFTLGAIAGLSDETPYSDDLVLRMLSHQEGLNFEPGTKFLYSNSGYVLLSIIVKRITGKPMNEVSRADLFTPLGMTSTRFQHDHSALIPNKAFGYVGGDDNAWHASNSMLDVVGDGGLYSSLDDMFQWMGNFDQPKVGAAELAAMEAPGKLADGKAIAYGMGLEPSTYRGLKVVDHGGALAGYRTEDMWFPTEHLSVVVLCNDGSADPSSLARSVADLYLTDAPQPVQKAVAAPPAKRPAVAVDAKRLEAYAGDYELRPGLILSFARESDHLVSRVNGADPTPMIAVSDRAFQLKKLPIEIDFDEPPAGGHSQSADLLQSGYPKTQIKRVDVPTPTAAQLKAYEGRYYNSELDVSYRVSVREGGLKLSYPGGDFDLSPVGADAFAAPPIGALKFTCSGGACDSLAVDNGRAVGVRFMRIPETPTGK